MPVISYPTLFNQYNNYTQEELDLLAILYTRINEKIAQVFDPEITVYVIVIKSDSFYNLSPKLLEKVKADIESQEWDNVEVLPVKNDYDGSSAVRYELHITMEYTGPIPPPPPPPPIP
jgi:hypothetical protein